MKSKYIFITFALVTTIWGGSLIYFLPRQDVEAKDDFVSYNKVTMKRSDAESVLAIISAEGFDNAFNHQSTYKDINDVKFHELRRAYIAASKELSNYLAEAAGKPDLIPYYMSFSN